LARKYNRFTRSRRSCGEYHFARGMVWSFRFLRCRSDQRRRCRRNSIRDTRGAHQNHITRMVGLFQRVQAVPPVFQIRHHCRFWRAFQNGRMSPFWRWAKIPRHFNPARRRSPRRGRGRVETNVSPGRHCVFMENGFLPREAEGVAAVAAGVVRCIGGKLKRRGCPQAPAGPEPGGVSRVGIRRLLVIARRAPNPTTLGTEIEGQIRLLNPESGPTKNGPIRSTNYWVATTALGAAF
jgi:hypothetical protein